MAPSARTFVLRKNNTESAAYKRNRICIFYAVGDPAALLFDFFQLGQQMHCGRQSAAHFELQREFPHFIYCYFWPGYAKSWRLGKNFLFFPTLPIDIVGIMVYS